MRIVGQESIMLDRLGLCHGCGHFLFWHEIASSLLPISPSWFGYCDRCGARVNFLNFGYDLNQDRSELVRVRWLGPEGSWTKEEPMANFFIASLLLVVICPGHSFKSHA